MFIGERGYWSKKDTACKIKQEAAKIVERPKNRACDVALLIKMPRVSSMRGSHNKINRLYPNNSTTITTTMSTTKKDTIEKIENVSPPKQLLFKPMPQSNSGLPLARLLVSLGPTLQILLAMLIAYRYYPVIPLRDLLFCVMYPTYLLLANQLRFKSNLLIRQRPKDHPHSISVVMSKFFSGSDDLWFKKYVGLAAVVGLLLPILTIFYGSSEVAVLAAPHLFVLWCQIIGESIVMFNPNVHRFITLLVPVGFSVYRMNLLVEWYLSSVALMNTADHASASSIIWGVVLSSINLIFWTYNLFVALLLKISPEFLSEEKCEYPELQVISLPFVGEPRPKYESKLSSIIE